MQNIGFIGLGAMGSGMAQNLLAKGFRLTVSARDPAQGRAWVDRGAESVPRPAQLAARCEAVVLCVSDTAAVHDVLFGPHGLAQGVGILRYVLDASTIAAEAARAFAARLQEQGITYLDSPVSGGPVGAARGTLACMVGGDTQAFEACLPVLESMATSVTRIGPVGAGQVCKACNQIGVLANLLGVAEIVALCRASGLDPQLVRSVLLTSSSRSAVLEVHAARLIEGDFAPRFRADLMLKDAQLAQELERAHGLAGPVARLAEALLAQLVAEGHGGQDWTAIGRLIGGDAPA
jgi:2-hydroxy-3-oxopropionate reductase